MAKFSGGLGFFGVGFFFGGGGGVRVLFYGENMLPLLEWYSMHFSVQRYFLNCTASYLPSDPSLRSHWPVSCKKCRKSMRCHARKGCNGTDLHIEGVSLTFSHNKLNMGRRPPAQSQLSQVSGTFQHLPRPSLALRLQHTGLIFMKQETKQLPLY